MKRLITLDGRGYREVYGTQDSKQLIEKKDTYFALTWLSNY
jgi:hypothetical protein